MFHFGYAMFQTVSVPWLSFKVQFSQTKQKGLLYLEKRLTAISGNWITSADEPP